MTTYILPGLRLTGSFSDGTLTYQRTAEFKFAVPEDYLFDYTYSDPATDGTSRNAFGIPEFNSFSASAYGAWGYLDRGVEPEEYYLYQLNFTDGRNAAVMEFYDRGTDSTYLFLLGGTLSALPASRRGFDALLAELDPDTPAQQIPSPGPISWAMVPGVRMEEDDLVYDLPGQDSSFNGGIGDDVIYTLDGDDLAFGGAGDDRLVATGGSGNEFFGQTGNDVLKFKGSASGTLHGGGGNDKLVGSVGDDMLNGDGGADTLIGLDGADRLNGASGYDKLYGGLGDDVVSGGAGDDILRGNRGNDTLEGGADSDRIYGGANDDTLRGEDGRDFLLGQTGNDVLYGGAGDDNLTGGQGSDTFMFSTGGGFDLVRDFENGIDLLDMSGTDATSLADITITAAGEGADTRLDFGDGDVIYLDGVTTDQIDVSDFVF